MQLRMKLDGNSDWYPELKTELIYAVSRLTERARNLAMEPVRNGMMEWPSMDSFYEWCRTKFGDPDKAMTARRELKEIRQKNIPFSTFSGDFLNIAAKTTMDEEGKILALEEGINQELANMIIHHDRPRKLDEFITLLQILENRLARLGTAGYQQTTRGHGTSAQALSQRGYSRGTFDHGGFGRGSFRGRGYFTPSHTSSSFGSSYSASSTSGTSAPSVSPGAPSVAPSDSISNFDIMDLDSLRGPQPGVTFKGKIPFHVNIARRQSGCCLYCGIPGHDQTVYRKFKCFNYGEAGHGARSCTKPCVMCL